MILYSPYNLFGSLDAPLEFESSPSYLMISKLNANDNTMYVYQQF